MFSGADKRAESSGGIDGEVIPLVFDGQQGYLCTVRAVELEQEVGHVSLHGMIGNVQRACYLPVAAAVGDK